MYSMALNQPVLAAAPFTWPKVFAGRQPTPDIMSEFVPMATAAEGAAVIRQSPVSSLSTLSREERRHRLMEDVSGVITNLLGTGECTTGDCTLWYCTFAALAVCWPHHCGSNLHKQLLFHMDKLSCSLT